MKKFFTQKAFLLFTFLFFFSIAAFSFAAFQETNEVGTNAKGACKAVKPAKNSEMLWEVVSHQFLSLVSL